MREKKKEMAIEIEIKKDIYIKRKGERDRQRVRQDAKKEMCRWREEGVRLKRERKGRKRSR